MTNVSGPIPETFLVGPEDFAYDVVAHPLRLYQVMQKPWIFIRAILHMQSMTPVRVAVRDLHRWWVHSHVEAFSSAHALATAKAAVSKSANIITGVQNASDVFAKTMHVTAEEFSRGMSANLANSMWNSLFGSKNTPPKIVKWNGGGRKRHMHAHRALRTKDHLEVLKQAERSHQNHLTGLCHSILHAHVSRKHWVPESALEKQPIGATHPKTKNGELPRYTCKQN